MNLLKEREIEVRSSALFLSQTKLSTCLLPPESNVSATEKRILNWFQVKKINSHRMLTPRFGRDKVSRPHQVGYRAATLQSVCYRSNKNMKMNGSLASVQLLKCGIVLDYAGSCQRARGNNTPSLDAKPRCAGRPCSTQT